MPDDAAGRPTAWAGGDDFAALGQTVAARLFSAGLDLHFVLMLIGDGPAAHRCFSALDELDNAIRQVRQLALAAQERAGDGQPRSGRGARRAARPEGRG